MRVILVLLASLLGGCILNRAGTGSDASALDAAPSRLDATVPLLDATAPLLDAGCDPGTVPCSTGCADTSADPSHCGGCGQLCTAPPDGTPTCAAAACGFVCNPGFERDGESCRVSPCGNRALDDGEDCDDGNAVSGDGCSPSCAMEVEPTDACPGAELWLGPARQYYQGETRGHRPTVHCSGPAAGPDAIFTIHTSWRGPLRVHVNPRGDWDVTLNFRPACPLIDGERGICRDAAGDNVDEEILTDVTVDGSYTVVVGGYQSWDAGSFELWFEGM